MRCHICGKGKVVGRSVSHSGVRTRRIFKPNLHWKRITVDGQITRIKMCTRCLKRMKKNAAEKTEQVEKVTQVTQVDQEKETPLVENVASV